MIESLLDCYLYVFLGLKPKINQSDPMTPLICSIDLFIDLLFVWLWISIPKANASRNKKINDTDPNAVKLRKKAPSPAGEGRGEENKHRKKCCVIPSS